MTTPTDKDKDRERASRYLSTDPTYALKQCRDDLAAEFAAVREDALSAQAFEVGGQLIRANEHISRLAVQNVAQGKDRDAWRARAEKAEAEAKMWKLCARSPAPPAKPDTGALPALATGPEVTDAANSRETGDP